jgi:small subunit ribosomal protein S16
LAVKLRLKRFGRTNRPFYRLNAMDARAPRDGKVIEQLGFYDPINRDPARQVNFDLDRIKYWLGVGAVPSDTVRSILVRAGLKFAERHKSRPAKVRGPRKKAAAEAPKA